MCHNYSTSLLLWRVESEFVFFSFLLFRFSRFDLFVSIYQILYHLVNGQSSCPLCLVWQRRFYTLFFFFFPFFFCICAQHDAIQHWANGRLIHPFIFLWPKYFHKRASSHLWRFLVYRTFNKNDNHVVMASFFSIIDPWIFWQVYNSVKWYLTSIYYYFWLVVAVFMNGWVKAAW